jgi:hypothetical protein
MTSRRAMEHGPSRSAWLPVALAWVTGIVALLAWLLGTSTGELRGQLQAWQFWSLESCLVLALLLGGYAFKGVLGEIERTDVVRMAGLATLAVGLTVLVAPRTNRIFYDEHIYQSAGQNLADLRRAQVCNDGNVEYGRLQCASGEYNKQPYAYPHVLSIMYRLFGVHEATGFVVNAAVMALTVCAVYLLVCVLFRDREAAFFAGLLLTLTPHQLLWSATAAVEPSASLALVVAMLSGAYYLRSGGVAALAAVAVTAAYAIQFRPESILILPVIAAMIWPRLRVDLKQQTGWWIGLLFLGLVATHTGQLVAGRNLDWGASGPRFSLDYVAGNLRVNGWFYLYDERFPMAYSMLALVGVAHPALRRERVIIAGYFLLLFGNGLLFYAGSYNYGADVRFSLMTYPPIAILGGLGASRLAGLVARTGAGVPARALTAAAVGFQFLSYAPVVRATTEEAWAARADVRFARSLASELPPNSYLLAHNPGMFHLWGINAGQMSRAVMNPHYVHFLTSRYAGGVYVHWNFWCNVQDEVQPEFCRKAVTMNTVELVREYTERDQRYALYRITKPPL